MGMNLKRNSSSIAGSNACIKTDCKKGSSNATSLLNPKFSRTNEVDSDKSIISSIAGNTNGADFKKSFLLTDKSFLSSSFIFDTVLPPFSLGLYKK